MIPRLASALAALALAVCCAGCAAEPAPAPSATGFASEEEAFAAAEETYRAYVDALNRVDLSDPKTFEDVYAWTTGDLNASDRTGLSNYHAEAATVSGESVVTTITSSDIDLTEAATTMAVCLDVSSIEVVDAAGASLVDPDRVEVQSIRVTLVIDRDSPTGLVISQVEPRADGPTCD